MSPTFKVLQNQLDERFSSSLSQETDHHLEIHSEEDFIAVVDSVIHKSIAQNSSGLLKTMAMEHFANQGKMIRPRLAFRIAQALNVAPIQVVGWAACCEILHNATLVHDDLQDRDEVRRGQITTWKKYGEEHAINLGDFLLLIAPQPVLFSDLSLERKHLLQYLFSSISAQIVVGQSLEFEMNELSEFVHLEEKYFESIGRKTAALFSAVALGVCNIAAVSPSKAQDIEALFYNCGLIFQIQDDILDLYGDKKRGTKGCDIREGKVSFLIVQHIKKHADDFLFLKGILKKSRKDTSLEDIDRVLALFKQKNTLDQSLSSLEEFIQSQNVPEEMKEIVCPLLSKILQPIEHLGVRCQLHNG